MSADQAVVVASRAKDWAKRTWLKLGRTKHLDGDMMGTQLNRCLTTLDITLMGIGNMVGSGVYVLTSSVAKNIAGPAIVVAFIISGIASLLGALCYAEFSSRFPRAGSAYSYTYLALGEFWAFTVGWNMVLENLIGIAAVSRAFSAYIDSVADGAIRNVTVTNLNATFGSHFNHLDFLAFAIVIAFLVFLSFGVRTTSHLNNFFSVVNIAVIIVIIVVGAYYSDTKNWTEVKGGFMPYGWKGVFAASASCFYAFIGFDAIATSGEEAQDPQRSIPIATMISMAFVTLAYVGVSSVLTLMVPYDQINDESGLPDALGLHGAGWAKILVIAGACCGMTCVLIGTMYSLTRIVYAMADDGLLFAWMSKINEKTQIPLKATYCFALCAALLALTLDITTLVEMMSIGTLLAYLVVSASVIVVRYQPIEPLHFSVAGDAQEEGAAPPPEVTGGETDERNTAFHYESRKDSITGGETRGLHPLIKNYLPQVDMDSRLRRYGPEALVTICVFTMTLLIFILCFLGPPLLQSNSLMGKMLIGFLALSIALSYAIIALHEQADTSTLGYKVPLVPLVPTLSIVMNVALMANLMLLTWVRLVFWMVVGFIVYFTYGIEKSVLNPESSRFKKGAAAEDTSYLTMGETASLSSAEY